MQRGRLPGRLPDRPERVAATRALLLARVRIGDGGLTTLKLPYKDFSSSMRELFSAEELRVMSRGSGLPVPFYDERGRVFEVVVRRSGRNYEFGGGVNGWERIVRFNDLRVNTVISTWVFREKMELGPIVELPRLLFVVEDNQRELFCRNCKRRCIYRAV